MSDQINYIGLLKEHYEAHGESVPRYHTERTPGGWQCTVRLHDGTMYVRKHNVIQRKTAEQLAAREIWLDMSTSALTPSEGTLSFIGEIAAVASRGFQLSGEGYGLWVALNGAVTFEPPLHSRMRVTIEPE